VLRLLALFLVLLPLACTEPYYDDSIGVEGVPTEAGSLAGTWALHQRFISVAFIPILGREIEGGSDQYFLVQRSWDTEQERYDDVWSFCVDISHESAGLFMETPTATRESVDLRDSVADVAHASGEYHSKDMLQLWALRDLPDSYGTPVPTPDNYRDAPQRDWIYDADGDGNIGCTMMLRGFLQGEDYYVNRKAIDYRGAVLSEDRVIGLIDVRAAWSVLESTVPVAVHTGELPSDEAEQHPDPRRSWFEMIRLDAAATCADVERAMNDEDLVKLYPY